MSPPEIGGNTQSIFEVSAFSSTAILAFVASVCALKVLGARFRLFQRGRLQGIQTLCSVVFGLCEGLGRFELCAIGERSLIGCPGIMDIMTVHSGQDLPLMHEVPKIGIYLLDTAVCQHTHSPGRVVWKSDMTRETQHTGQVAYLNSLNVNLLCSLLGLGRSPPLREYWARRSFALSSQRLPATTEAREFRCDA